jgi:hypothetical protein
MRTVFGGNLVQESASYKDSKFALTPFSAVGQLRTRTLQLGGREHRCMRAGRRRVICSATVHCDETSTSSESPTCSRASAEVEGLSGAIVSPMVGRGCGGVGGNTA